MLHRVLVIASLLGGGAAFAEQGWRREAHLLTVAPGSGWLDGFGGSLIAVGRVRPGRIESVVYDLAASDAGTPPSLLDLLLGRARVRALRVGTVTRAVAHHASANRSVWTQRLALDERQVAALHAALQAELDAGDFPLLPIRASSSSRARDLLDRSLGGALRARLSGPSAASLRERYRRTLAGDAVALLALDLFLGRRLDRPLDRFEAAGSATELRDALAGGEPALADPPRSILHRRGAEPVAAGNAAPATIGALSLAGALLILGVVAWRGGRWQSGLFLLLGPVLLGLLGGCQLLLGLASALPEARLNELPLFYLPTDLALLFPAISWLRAGPGAARPPGKLLLGYAALRLGLVGLGLLGHLLGLLRQEPRALLAPALVSAVGLCLLVVRSRSQARASRA